ncbi:hypothetical protein Ancab_004727 [Ancistrocladus abbreviatus]
MLRWRKEHLEDLIRQSEQPMDGQVSPALSQWINKAKEYASDELNIEELKKRTRGKCCLDIEAGLVIDEKMRELKMLIVDGQRISGEFATRGYIWQEITTIGSAMAKVKGAIWREVSQGVAGTICIHGIIGVGKTAIAATINNQALRATGLFDFVIWVDVSNGADLQQVQEDIARSIPINFSPDSNINTKAGLLRTTLMRKNRFLLILDSWQGYSPSDIGIPELTRGRKLIVTSRIFFVSNSFKGRKFYEIKPLVGADAWNLFAYEVGYDVMLNLPDHILTRAKTAIQDLQGVPLAITKVAETLRNIYEALGEWANIVAEWQLEELLMIGDINSRGCVWGSNKLRDWNGACVEWLLDLGHLAVLKLVFLNASVFKSYMEACPKTADQYAYPATRFKFCSGGFHSASFDSNLYENSFTVIGDNSVELP